jgi:hypothetical protein
VARASRAKRENNAAAFLEEELRLRREIASVNSINEDKIIERYKNEEPEALVKAVLDAKDLVRIGDLGDFYELKEIPGDQRVRLRDNKVEDKELLALAKELAANPSLINPDTPVEAIKLKNQIYPTTMGLMKIDTDAKEKTTESLLSLALSKLHTDAGHSEIVSPSRRAQSSPDLLQALERQGMFKTQTTDIQRLRNAGLHEDREGREAAGTWDAIRDGMIGDLDRGYNPIHGAPYGGPKLVNGKLVREQVDGGHIIEAALNKSQMHNPDNLIAELHGENIAKKERGKGIDVSDEKAFLNAIAKAKQQKLDFTPFLQGMEGLAIHQPSLRPEIERLIKIAELRQ